jgi:hypothetical protein
MHLMYFITGAHFYLEIRRPAIISRIFYIGSINRTFSILGTIYGSVITLVMRQFNSCKKDMESDTKAQGSKQAQCKQPLSINGIQSLLEAAWGRIVGKTMPSTAMLAKQEAPPKCAPQASELSIPLHATSNSLTASTLTVRPALSASSSSISTIFSTPPAPIITGTPT